jgi:hypothetical protein
MYIGVILIILICICVQVYKSYYGKVVNISKKEVYSQDIEGDIFIEVIISSEDVYMEYLKKYHLDFEVENIDFSKNNILLTSNYEVKALSYNEKNRKVSTKDNNILDVIYYKGKTGKLYIYEIPHKLITWDVTRAYKATVFE